MKKFLFICLCMSSVFFLCAQEKTVESSTSVSDENIDLQKAHEKNSADRIAAINTLLKKKELKKNFDSIRMESMGLSVSEKENLFSKHKDNPILPFALNFCLGYGIGSFVQKDTLSGIVCLSADVIASGLFIATTAIILNDVLSIAKNSSGTFSRYSNIRFSSNPFDVTFSVLNASNTLGLVIAGAVISGASRIYGMLAPWGYESFYNGKLKKALGLENTEISFSPIVLPGASYGLAISVRY